MNKVKIFLIFVLFYIFILPVQLSAKDFGFGIMLGDPLAITGKLWVNKENAIDAYIGGSYFGALRIGADYLWHFDAFQSKIVLLYAGAGATIGFGRGREIWYKYKKGYFYYREEGESGIGVRAIMGLNIIPRRTPIEIFFEVGPMVGIIPSVGVGMDASIGIRFYP